MSNYITFNKTVKGSSHDVSGKPCQDFSISEELDGGCILIVCDGHGGDTYVRSDVGSKLAANIALSKIKEFIADSSPKLFLDHAAALTSLPSKNPLISRNGQSVEYSSLSESQQEIVLQAKSYLDNVKLIPEQKNAFTKLFEAIYSTWLEEIAKDAKQHPFSEEEKKALGNHSLTKAYGSTLMAYVQTNFYWFGFHIGDGKMLACNREIVWSEPVPWDCTCFLNLTTSLCDVNPIPEFRFAFDGTGKFPVAVFLGSDGIDDSFVTSDNLRKFYTQTLSIFSKSDDLELTLLELEEYLPKLSKKASHDDMSIAGFIDLTAIKDGLELQKVCAEGHALKESKMKNSKELEDLQTSLTKLKSEYDRISSELESGANAFKVWWNEAVEVLCSKKESIFSLKCQLNAIEHQIKQITPSLEEKENFLATWEPQNKIRFGFLTAERERLLASIRQADEDSLSIYKQNRDGLLNQDNVSNNNYGVAEENACETDKTKVAIFNDTDLEVSIDEEAKLQSKELLSAHEEDFSQIEVEQLTLSARNGGALVEYSKTVISKNK